MIIHLKKNIRLDVTLPIGPVSGFTSSALPLEFVDIPGEICGAAVVAVAVTVTNADGVAATAPCEHADGVWRVIFAASCFEHYGYVESGVSVALTLRDGSGNERRMVLAVGDLEVKRSSPSAAPGDPEKSYQIKGEDIFVKTRIIDGVQHYARQEMSYDGEMGAWGADWLGDYILVDGEFVPFQAAGGTAATVATALLALLLVPFSAFGITATKEYVDRKDGEIAALSTNIVTTATKAMLDAARGYTDTAIAQIPPPNFSTNNAALVATIEATAPAPGDYAAVSNKAMTAVQPGSLSFTNDYIRTSWADDNTSEFAGHANEANYADSAGTAEWATNADYADRAGDSDFSHYAEKIQFGANLSDAKSGEEMLALNKNYTDNATSNLARVAHTGSYNDLSNKPTIPTVPTAQINAATTTNALQDAELESHASQLSQLSQSLDGKVPTSRTINGKALTSNISLSADEVGAASSNDVEEVRTDNAQTRQIVTTWENFLDGSNVVFSITNYLSGSYNLDAAKLRILELRDGAYQEVYNSRDEILLHIDDFSNRYVRVALDAIVDEVAARLASKADRDWGKYTSAGGDAPANTVYMTAPNTVFAGGLEYERVAVGEGTICVLTTRGAPVWTQGDEGTFKFQDDGGTNYFGFAKTDSYTIGANTDGITVQGGMVTMNYNITMSGRPCVWYKSSLSSGAWEQLNLPDGSPVAGASHAVTWEANPDPGTQVCYINVGNAPSGFFRATVEVAGEAKFMTNMPADLSGGWICPNTATGVNGVIKPTFDGTSVIWTWSAK